MKILLVTLLLLLLCILALLKTQRLSKAGNSSYKRKAE